MNTGKKEYTFLWFIKNYSCCWHKNGEELESPQFRTEGLEGTAWDLWLYPRGETDEEVGWISLFLNRSDDDSGPESVSVTYEFSVLGAEGSALFSEESENAFQKDDSYGVYKFLNTVEVLSNRKSQYLPHDTLRIRCKIWKGKGEVQPQAQISARTRIGIEQISFLHLTENFSTRKPNHKETEQIKFPTENGLALSCSLCLPEDFSGDGKIMVEITSSESNYILCLCRLSLIARSGKKIECGEIDNVLDTEGNYIRKLPLTLGRQDFIDKRIEYLPNDTLSLSCECKFSTGELDYETIESVVYDATESENKFMTSNHFDDIYAEQLTTCPTGLHDFKSIHDDRFLTDFELKTKTRSFPVHKLVLYCRSSVFKMMLTNDMKERITNCIQIDNLEETTVQRFLLFLYSDELKNLEWDSAIKLYYAGDKYSVGKLKLMCCSFLVQNLSTSNASELLLLADRHSDSFLKKTVEDFILSHEEAVYSSEEWRSLIKTNSVLVSEMMCLKYMKK